MRKVDKEFTLEELFGYLDELPADMECFKIGRLSKDYQARYKDAYDHFIEVNEGDFTKKEKGKSLEELVQHMFQSTGQYYRVYANVRNGSNEIHIILRLSNKGMALKQLIDDKYQKLIGECKNYDKKVSVTYVGKFYSLMRTTHCNFGIVFSYHGISGENWGGGKGLIKKLFLLSEGSRENLYILDFCKTDFEEILSGQSIFEILNKKCFELETGADCMKQITEHPNEEKMKKYID